MYEHAVKPCNEMLFNFLLDIFPGMAVTFDEYFDTAVMREATEKMIDQHIAGMAPHGILDSPKLRMKSHAGFIQGCAAGLN